MLRKQYTSKASANQNNSIMWCTGLLFSSLGHSTARNVLIECHATPSSSIAPRDSGIELFWNHRLLSLLITRSVSLSARLSVCLSVRRRIKRAVNEAVSMTNDRSDCVLCAAAGPKIDCFSPTSLSDWRRCQWLSRLLVVAAGAY